MLKRLALLPTILLLCALPAAAQSPPDSGTDLARLSEPAPADTLGDPEEDILVAIFGLKKPAGTARKPPSGWLKAQCNEDCNELADISCTGGACSAISRDCSVGVCERGSVTCDGNTTFCSQACPPNCTLFACRQPCEQAGCFAACTDRCNCTCETICN